MAAPEVLELAPLLRVHGFLAQGSRQLTSSWRYDEHGKASVVQVDRQGCALILTDHWPEKVGKALMFISLNGEREAQITALDA